MKTPLLILAFILAACNKEHMKDGSQELSREDSARLFTTKYFSPDSFYFMHGIVLPPKSKYESTGDYVIRSTKHIDSLYGKPMEIEVYAKHDYNPETEEFLLSIETDKIKIGSQSYAKEIIRLPMVHISDWDSILNNPNGKMNMVYGLASYNKPVWNTKDTIKIKCSKAEAQNADKRLRLIFIIKLSPEFASLPIESKSDSLNDYAARSGQLTQSGEYEVIENITFGANVMGYYVIDSENGEMKEKKLFSL